MRLSQRLEVIYSFIREGDRVADIGSDHGYIPLKLIEDGVSDYIVLVDISKDSLKKGRDNIERFTKESNAHVDYRLGDGLKVIDFGEVDDVIIAGMGGRLIVDILRDDINKTDSFGKLILQPRNHSGELRYWLYKNGYNITRDILVRENRHIPEIIVAEKGLSSIDVEELKDSSVELEVPLHMCENDKDILSDFLERKVRKTEILLDNLKKSNTLNINMIKEYEYRLKYLRFFLKRVI